MVALVLGTVPLGRPPRLRYLGDQDPTTHRMLEEILASEEEHAEDLSSLLEGMKDYGKV